jgi:hypothetical protein
MASPLRSERRVTARIRPHGGSEMARARLRPGRTAQVVDLSAGGALIETDCRLLPGTRVELQLGQPASHVKVAGKILRCHVALVDRERIRYRGAVAFEQRLSFGEPKTPPGSLNPLLVEGPFIVTRE